MPPCRSHCPVVCTRQSHGLAAPIGPPTLQWQASPCRRKSIAESSNIATLVAPRRRTWSRGNHTLSGVCPGPHRTTVVMRDHFNPIWPIHVSARRSAGGCMMATPIDYTRRTLSVHGPSSFGHGLRWSRSKTPPNPTTTPKTPKTPLRWMRHIRGGGGSCGRCSHQRWHAFPVRRRQKRRGSPRRPNPLRLWCRGPSSTSTISAHAH